ncbi:MAG: hypothetical protein RBR01_10095 [Desulfobacterales bacterium]|jgi:hypothetical protein|nr:hypothetical protein [Desulfobacterales bacterium]
MEEIKIDCYLFPECASEEPLRINMNSALTAEKIKVNVGFHRIDNDEAAGLGLSGSPSVFINSTFGNGLVMQKLVYPFDFTKK